MAYEQLKLDNQVCFRLYTAARLITQCYTPLLKQLGLTYPQYLTMMLLWEKDHQVIGELTERLKLETNTVTPMLQRMEKQGLITRTKGLTDNRQRIISLTEMGKQLEEKAKDVPECLMKSVTKNGLTVNEVAALAPLLDNLIEAIEQPEETK